MLPQPGAPCADRVSGRLKLCLRLAVAALALGFSAAAAQAQSPYVTDDTGITARRAWHFELFEQFARLPDSARPTATQSTTVLSVAYGLAPRLELGFDVPLITFVTGEQRTSGLGDLDFTAKFLLRDDADGKRTAFALAGAVELPTGNPDKGLGSGVTDKNLSFVMQRAVAAKTTLQTNFGVQFAGNTLTGLVGVRDRAMVASAGTSLIWSLSDASQLGAELTGYQGRSRDVHDRELRLQVCTTHTVSPHLTLAAALQHGWFATPPWTVQAGLVIDP